MKKLLITALALGSLGLVACTDKEADAAAPEGDESSQTEAPKAKTVAFAITGMT